MSQISNIQSLSLWQAPKNFFVDGKINKESVNRDIEFPVIKVNNQNMKTVTKILKRFCPDLNNFDNYIQLENDLNKLGLILDPELIENIDEQLNVKEKTTLKGLIEEITPDKLEYTKKCITYENYRLSTLLKWLLPNENLLSGFTNTGHIVHLNLKESHMPYKYAIGTLLLDRVASAKCVVSKVNKIDTEFRTFELDLLAGEPIYVTSLKEHGAEFALDFSKVYWNSRLSTEHSRICDSLDRNDVVYDACAGIGPFAIPAAKKGCQVFANDLNDESVKWLKHNVVLNSSKKKKINVNVYNMDANDFIKDVAIGDMVNRKSASDAPTRFFLLMNLPSIAVTFLHSIVDSEHLDNLPDGMLLNVRCYCFIGKECPQEAIEKQIYDQLGDRVLELNLRLVRNVAPNKDMFCAEILVRLSNENNNNDAVAAKKRKLIDDE